MSIETLWQIAQEVAKADSTYCNETNGCMLCPFCNGWLPEAGAYIHKKPFPHQQGCIVTKARELVQAKEQQEVPCEQT